MNTVPISRRGDSITAVTLLVAIVSVFAFFAGFGCGLGYADSLPQFGLWDCW